MVNVSKNWLAKEGNSTDSNVALSLNKEILQIKFLIRILLFENFLFS